MIVDLKQKIQGNFSLVSKDDEKIIVRTTSCPFDAFVRQSPSLCFMTSSVFGGIAARNFGYAKVVLHRRIALGDDGCYVAVHLRRTPEAEAAVGREYAPDVDRASPDIAQQLRLMDNLRRLREQLDETSSRWEELVRAAADAICAVGPDGTVTFANARWRELLGVEGEELVGGTLDRLVHPDDAATIGARLRDVLKGRRAAAATCRLRHRSGRWRDVLLSAGPIRNETGQVFGALVIVHDLTAQRELERAKDELVSAASHELRTPVATIRGTAELLLRTLRRDGSADPAQLAQRLERIRAEADRLVLLSNDLVEVTRLQAGKLPLDRERFDIRATVEACVRRTRESADQAGRHRFSLDQPDRAVVVDADPRRLEQILNNLLENAVKYSPEGGAVTVATRVDGVSVRVSVVDEGIGIPAGEIVALFQPFARASNATSRSFPGLGLGLYLSRGIAEAHGGALAVESAEGEGTTFTLTLPLAESVVRDR